MRTTAAALLAVGLAAGLASPAAAEDGSVDHVCDGLVCHADVPPGHYQVTVDLAAGTSVRAEARRLMVGAGPEADRRRFVVNVREPEGQPTGQGGTGTPGLTLTFEGAPPTYLKIKPAPDRYPVIYLAGDSTVCDQPAFPYAGWGQDLPRYFGRRISVANYADSGENSSTFLSDPALASTMLQLLKDGDLVLIQFGHNDKQTTADDYRRNLTTLVSEVRTRGAVPVLATPPVRRIFSGSALTPTALHVNGLGVDLPAEMRTVAAAEQVPLIDLTAQTRDLVQAMGPEASKDLFLHRQLRDNTHFSDQGAASVSRLVFDSLRDFGLLEDSRLSPEE